MLVNGVHDEKTGADAEHYRYKIGKDKGSCGQKRTGAPVARAEP